MTGELRAYAKRTPTVARIELTARSRGNPRRRLLASPTFQTRMECVQAVKSHLVQKAGADERPQPSGEYDEV
jgi:hypothetical protein